MSLPAQNQVGFLFLSGVQATRPDNNGMFRHPIEKLEAVVCISGPFSRP